MEAAPSLRNKIRQSFLYLVDLRPGSNDGLGGCLLAGASDLGGLGLPVPANRHGIFFRGGVSGGRRHGCAEASFGIYDVFPDFVGGVGFGKMYEFAGSGDLLSLERFELDFCPSLFFFIDGGGMSTNSSCRVGSRVPVLVDQSPFRVLRRPADWSFRRFLRRQVPQRLTMCWPLVIFNSRIVQR